MDSTNGKNGTWTTVVTVTGNLVMNRAHSFDFTGQRWARLVLTGPTPKTYEYGIQLDEILLHDVSNGTDDSWIFVGDSITAEIFRLTPEHQPSFPQLVQKVDELKLKPELIAPVHGRVVPYKNLLIAFNLEGASKGTR